MKRSEIRSLARVRLFDTVAPYLWSDDEINQFITDAENEACRRARLLLDSGTPEITRINVSPTKTEYDLDCRIIFVRRVKLASRSKPLQKVSHKTLDECQQGWEDEVGQPRGYIMDLTTNKLQPFPKSDVADVIRLTVVRLPLCAMTKDSESPEINHRFHESLIYWVCFRAYTKDDTDTKDDKKATDNLALFEQEFGKKSSAIDETWIQQENGYIDDDGTF